MQQGFEVRGMSCEHCVRAVSASLRRIDADASVRVDLQSGRVEVESRAPRERLAEAIRDEGYEVVA
jgi:copper chaperone